MKTNYVNFHSLEVRTTAPPILSMATYQTQRIIRGYLGRKRYAKKRAQIKSREDAAKREHTNFMRAACLGSSSNKAYPRMHNI